MVEVALVSGVCWHLWIVRALASLAVVVGQATGAFGVVTGVLALAAHP